MNGDDVFQAGEASIERVDAKFELNFGVRLSQLVEADLIGGEENNQRQRRNAHEVLPPRPLPKKARHPWVGQERKRGRGAKAGEEGKRREEEKCEDLGSSPGLPGAFLGPSSSSWYPDTSIS